MVKEQYLIYFLGQLKVHIANLSQTVCLNKSPLYDKLAELEQFFNKSIETIYFSDINDLKNDDKLNKEMSFLIKKMHE